MEKYKDEKLRARSFKVLEDSKDLSFLEAIAAEGTHKAYFRAVEVSDFMVEVRNDTLIKKLKNGTVNEINS